MKKKTLAVGILLLFAIYGIARLVLPSYLSSKFDRILYRSPYHVSDRALKLHKSLSIVDLHADSLLFGRNLLRRSSSGHIDIPRLVEANVAVQAFTVVTQVPTHLNIERNSDRSDSIRYLAIAEAWPPSTWTSTLQRALYQARQLRQYEASSGANFLLIRSRADLDRFLARRTGNPHLTAGFLGLEGAQALQGDLGNLDVLYNAGFRTIAPTHFFDTDLAGSSSGATKGGLTAKGREFVSRAESRGLIIDLAHASAATILDVATLAKRPVFVSHTGVRGTCNNSRNLSDDEMRAIARTGGIIGIGYWKTATCGTNAAAAARAMRYTANLVGVEHVALGSDFDGATTEPFDVTGLPIVTEALIQQGFSDQEIRMIMGENALRFLRQNLPE
jgi:membrane dipeptidase